MILLADLASLAIVLSAFVGLFLIGETLIDAIAHHYDRPGLRIAHDPTYGDCRECGTQGVQVTEYRLSPLLDPELRCRNCTPAKATA